MNKGIFIVGTSTDIGKTYISGLLVKKLNEKINVGYYKPIMSGAKKISNSDVGYIKNFSNIEQNIYDMFSYSFKEAVSPHLASKIENKSINKNKILKDFNYLKSKYEYLIVEGCGGIICPIIYDNNNNLFLEDIIKILDLEVILVTDSNVGTINSTLLTINYIKLHNINIKGIIFNNYKNNIICDDNIKLIKDITNIPITAIVKKNEKNIKILNKFM